MSSDVTQLLNRLRLSHYQERLADNGFESLECLYGITEHDFEALDIEHGDRRTLQQELRKREAQHCSRDLAASSANSLSHATPGTEASATVSNGDSAVALRHPKLEPTRRSELFQRQRTMYDSLIEGLHPEAWGYLINPSDSFTPTIILHKKQPSITLCPPSNVDRHATNSEQRQSQSSGSAGGTGGMAVVEDLSANGTAVNGVIVGQNNLLELRDNDEVRVADEAHFLFRYSTHNTPRFEQHYIMRDAVGKGHFATVRSCSERATKVVYAVKLLRKTTRIPSKNWRYDAKLGC
ncbi:hypothetical protein ACEPPN_000750 [Leptodophora sp. 'Broadleaf-Isolate-01']